MKINVTLSIEKEIYEKYKKYCEKNAIALSKSIELFMKSKIEGANNDEE